MIATYYKGRTSFAELMNMPLSYINALYRIAEERSKTKEGQEQMKSEAVQDAIEEAVT